ncbi:S1C family serine protease [Corallococcus terminator]|uniref:PDZ domain-containing protein n=1 Tax=Corallococcus terminator TaxID=2316733 RepID=A0A3A8IW17_9BACT|nr:trypsin-like peptidase domain-containing protein [Corallococcus terminator]RKG87677.1 PDZ domain-containing protein [Corallococcus terminator]
MGWTRFGGVIKVAVLACALGATARVEARDKKLWMEAQNRAVSRQHSNISEVARKAMPAVVSITTRQDSADVPEGEEPQRGIGSGFIIHPDGYILTSAHVVEGASEVTISVRSANGYVEEFPATVVGEDERTDCALLKVDAPRKLPVLKLASASHVGIADWVVVIGNPFGLAHSVTVGVVSYLGRTDVTPNGRDGDFDYVQIDASINPGNSGGPVLDLHGDVVAVANAVNVSGQGIGFAIPIDIAKTVIPQLKAHGRMRRGWIGISVQDFSPEVAAAFNLMPRGRGVVVTDVVEDSPAARAGLRAGDVILDLDRRTVERAHTLRWQVAARGVGQHIRLQVRRVGRPMTMRVKLDALPFTEADVPPATLASSAAPGGRPAEAKSVLEDLLSPVPRASAGQAAGQGTGGSGGSKGMPVP